MAYGLNTALFVEDGPTAKVASLAATRSASRFLAWRKLNPESRFEAVEKALAAPANDLIDSYPLAL